MITLEKLDTNNPKHQALFAIPSMVKLVEDMVKYKSYSIFPRCDICGEEYYHYYIKDDLWPSELHGWICGECVEEITGHKIEEEDITDDWGNLFEVHTDFYVLDQILERVDIAGDGKSEPEFLFELIARIYSREADEIVKKTVKFVVLGK